MLALRLSSQTPLGRRELNSQDYSAPRSIQPHYSAPYSPFKLRRVRSGKLPQLPATRDSKAR